MVDTDAPDASTPGLGLLRGKWAEPIEGQISRSGNSIYGTATFVPSDRSDKPFKVIVVSLSYGEFWDQHKYQRTQYASYLVGAGHATPDTGWRHELRGLDPGLLTPTTLGDRIRTDLLGRETWLLSDLVEARATTVQTYVRRRALTAKDVLVHRGLKAPDIDDHGLAGSYEPANGTVYDLALSRGSRGVVLAWVNAPGGGRSLRLPRTENTLFFVPETNYLTEKLGGAGSTVDIEAIQGFLRLALSVLS